MKKLSILFAVLICSHLISCSDDQLVKAGNLNPAQYSLPNQDLIGGKVYVYQDEISGKLEYQYIELTPSGSDTLYHEKDYDSRGRQTFEVEKDMSNKTYQEYNFTTWYHYPMFDFIGHYNDYEGHTWHETLKYAPIQNFEDTSYTSITKRLDTTDTEVAPIFTKSVAYYSKVLDAKYISPYKPEDCIKLSIFNESTYMKYNSHKKQWEAVDQKANTVMFFAKNVGLIYYPDYHDGIKKFHLLKIVSKDSLDLNYQ